MIADVFVERNALHPIHQQYIKLVGVRVVGVYKQFLFKILNSTDIIGRNVFQFICDETIPFFALLLFFQKTLHGIQLPRVSVFHLEDHGKVSARHHKITIII